MKYFTLLRPTTNNVRLEYILWKNVWFCFISIVWVHFSHKTEKFRFWKSLKYFTNFLWKRYGVRFEDVPWKNNWFCFIFTVWVHFNHKTQGSQPKKSQILFMVLCSIFSNFFAFFMISDFVLCQFYTFQTQNNNLRQNSTPWIDVTWVSEPICFVHLELKTFLTLCLL